MGGVAKSIGNFAGDVGGAVGDVVGGITGQNAANKAAEAQVNAEQTAMSRAAALYNQAQGNLQPYISQGTTSLGQLGSMLGPSGALGRQFTMADFQQSPAYQFNLQQGLNAINNAQSVRGGALSGGAQKAAMGYAQQNASNEFQNAYNRFTQNQQQNYQQLANTAQMGQNASATLGNIGNAQAAQQGQYLQGMGNAQAAGTVGGYNAIARGLTSGLAGLGASNLLSGLGGGTADWDTLAGQFGTWGSGIGGTFVPTAGLATGLAGASTAATAGDIADIAMLGLGI